MEKEEDNYLEGYVRIVSKDPTVSPKIIANYLDNVNERDLDDFTKIMIGTMFPVMLEMRKTGHFESLASPSASDVLKNVVTDFFSLDDIDK